MTVLDTVLGRIVAPTGAVGFAFFAEQRGWGLFNMVALHSWSELLLALFLLDLAIYFQHRLFHYFSVLWRLHRMHHADLDVDVTTGARFHLVCTWSTGPMVCSNASSPPPRRTSSNAWSR